VLSALGEAPALNLYDADNKPRVALGLLNPGPVLELRDSSGESSAILALDGFAPRLSLHSTDGKPYATLAVHGEGPVLVLCDRGGSTANLGAIDNGGKSGGKRWSSAASLHLLDKDGNVVWRAP
jgi:hypothetical protein